MQQRWPEVDQLRKSMATFKFTGGVSKFKDKLVSGMERNGYTREFAEKTFSQLEGFGSYGFPESHAANFALIAYASSYVKCNHPDAFCAALLNSQPMGFYASAQIFRDARKHAVDIRPICVNRSRWDCTLESIEGSERHAVRLGMRMIHGLRRQMRHASLPLTEADAFLSSLNLQCSDALWAIKALRDEPLPLFAAAADRERRTIAELQEPEVDLRAITEGQRPSSTIATPV